MSRQRSSKRDDRLDLGARCSQDAVTPRPPFARRGRPSVRQSEFRGALDGALSPGIGEIIRRRRTSVSDTRVERGNQRTRMRRVDCQVASARTRAAHLLHRLVELLLHTLAATAARDMARSPRSRAVSPSSIVNPNRAANRMARKRSQPILAHPRVRITHRANDLVARCPARPLKRIADLVRAAASTRSR